MFGDGVADEITSNILALEGYPKGLSVAMVAFIAMIPLTKTPLNSRPIITTLEIVLGVNSLQESGFRNQILKFVIRSTSPPFSLYSVLEYLLTVACSRG